MVEVVDLQPQICIPFLPGFSDWGDGFAPTDLHSVPSFLTHNMAPGKASGQNYFRNIPFYILQVCSIFTTKSFFRLPKWTLFGIPYLSIEWLKTGTSNLPEYSDFMGQHTYSQWMLNCHRKGYDHITPFLHFEMGLTMHSNLLHYC